MSNSNIMSVDLSDRSIIPLLPIISSKLPVTVFNEIIHAKRFAGSLGRLGNSLSRSESSLTDSVLDEIVLSKSESDLSDCSFDDDVFSGSDINLSKNNLGGSSSEKGKCIFSTGDLEVELYNRVLEQMPDCPPCRVKVIAGKGIGIVAERKLYPGDLIMAEAPIISVPETVFDDMEATETWLDRAINRLDSQQREVLMCLTDCRHPEDPTYLGRFYTNCMYSGDSVTVCPVMARANHSCRPNAEFVGRADLGVNELKAMYVIEAGEEVTINYLPMAEEGSDVREVRQTYLRRFYGFHCTCRACTMEEKELEEEETLRETMKELQAWGSKNWTPEEVSTVIAGMYRIQGKLSHLLDIMETCFQSCTDQVLKMEYSLRGLSLAISLFGLESQQTKVWTERASLSQPCLLHLWADCCLLL